MATAHARRVVPLTALVLFAACGTPSDRSITDPGAARGPSFAASNLTNWSTPKNLGDVINTRYNEAQPALSKDGLSLYFSSNRPDCYGEPVCNDPVLDDNIWVSQRACTDSENPGCAWGAPVRLGPPVNTEFTDAAPSLSRDDHWLFFASARPLGMGMQDIWIAYRENVHDDFAWTNAVNLGPGINTAAAEIAPSYFENEGGAPQLFFNRGNAPGDIYMSELRADGTWGVADPVKALNSPNSDQRASIKFNGLEIYFWSDRPVGKDTTRVAHIWQSTRESASDDWSPPTLVGSPISDRPGIHPFIYSHGRTETLLLVRNMATPPARNFDLFMSTRTRGKP